MKIFDREINVRTDFRMKTADEQYKQGFVDELQAFRERVRKRAKQKVDDAVKQYEAVGRNFDICLKYKNYICS
jgi:hypothetical protein